MLNKFEIIEERFLQPGLCCPSLTYSLITYLRILKEPDSIGNTML